MAENGIGTLWLYPIIPSEMAGELGDAKSRLSDFPSNEDGGIYITERFMPVTVKASNFEQRHYYWFEDGSRGEELALYYLDLSAPERFFGYMNYNVADFSHWYFANANMRRFLAKNAA